MDEEHFFKREKLALRIRVHSNNKRGGELEMQEIQVCFAIHDKDGQYSKYLGVAIISMLKKTNSKVHIHIIHDEYLSKTNKDKFVALIDKYGQKLSFYEIKSSVFSDFGEQVGVYSIGTLFRLFLPEILPSNIERVVYMDADILINTDINELWNIDLETNHVAACRDYGLPYLKHLPIPCLEERVSANEYFNAGIMVINLKFIRNDVNFTEKCIDMLKEKPNYNYLDQDVYNVIFRGEVKYLLQKYNLFSKYVRDPSCEAKDCIIHFAADNVNIDSPSWFDSLFLSYLKESPWSGGEYTFPLFLSCINNLSAQLSALYTLFNIVANKEKNIYVWGAESVLCKQLYKFYNIKERIRAYIDTNIELHKKTIDGKKVYSPKHLEKDQKSFVLVASKKHYDEITDSLMRMG